MSKGATMETNGTKQGQHTPRTDAAVVSPAFIAREMDHYKHKFVLADVSREIERENADLLAALKEMVRIWEGPRDRAAVGFAAAVVQARAAIARARGQA